MKSLSTAEQFDDFSKRILEELDIEHKKPIENRDKFYINRLCEIYRDCQERFQAEKLKINKGETA